MSRCFPYPPPGYSPNTASNYALIESIKLQRDKERVKLERRKEKKRKKKERNRNKGEKNANQESTSSCSRTDNLISGGDKRESKTRFLKRDIEDEINERLGNSSLSEEHGQPVYSKDPSYSSDSTQNNNKRKRSISPSNGIHGPVVDIRLSSHDHGQCDISNQQALVPFHVGSRTTFIVRGQDNNCVLLQIAGE